MKELTAGEITEIAMMELKLRGFEVWRQNQISQRGRPFHGRKGAADITGYHLQTGLRLECECKTIDDYLSSDQISFLESIHAANAYAFIAYDNGNRGIHIISLPEYYVKRLK